MEKQNHGWMSHQLRKDQYIKNNKWKWQEPMRWELDPKSVWWRKKSTNGHPGRQSTEADEWVRAEALNSKRRDWEGEEPWHSVWNIDIKAFPKALGREVEGPCSYKVHPTRREVTKSICSNSDGENRAGKSTEAKVNRQSAVTERRGNKEMQ